MQLNSIPANTQKTYYENVRVLQNIGKNAVITIKGGSLIVDGDIEEGAKIKLKVKPNYKTIPEIKSTTSSNNGKSSSITIITGLTVADLGDRFNIEVKGKVGKNVTLSVDNGDVKVKTLHPTVITKCPHGKVYVDGVLQQPQQASIMNDTNTPKIANTTGTGPFSIPAVWFGNVKGEVVIGGKVVTEEIKKGGFRIS